MVLEMQATRLANDLEADRLSPNQEASVPQLREDRFSSVLGAGTKLPPPGLLVATCDNRKGLYE